MRWVCSVIGALVALPGLERRRHVALAVEIDRQRQRVHHGAAAALPDVRRQRMRGVADHRDLARRPALEPDVFEAVVAALVADAVDQRLEMRKPALPGVAGRPARPSPPRRCRAWSARYRPRSRCTACRARGGCRTSIRPWWRRPAPRSSGVLSISSRVQPSTRYLRLASRPRLSRSRELVPSAAITRSALSVRPSASVSSPSGVGGDRRRIEHDLGAGHRRADSASALITVWRTIENTRLPCQRCTEITRFWSSRTSRVCANGAPFTAAVIGADRLQHAQPVLVDVDAGAGGAQPIGALVHAHAPAALGERAGRGQPGKARADDFRMSLPSCRHVTALRDQG